MVVLLYNSGGCSLVGSGSDDDGGCGGGEWKSVWSISSGSVNRVITVSRSLLSSVVHVHAVAASNSHPLSAISPISIGRRAIITQVAATR